MPNISIMPTYQGTICKGSWSLRSACGVCQKCIDTKAEWHVQHLLELAKTEHSNNDKWISIHKRMPERNQRIIGKSNTGQWEENFDPDEPFGNMTHWRSV